MTQRREVCVTQEDAVGRGISSSPTSSTCTAVTRSITTCIVGGGNSAHVLVPFLAQAGHHVHLLTRRPDDWDDVVYCDIVDGDTGLRQGTHCGRLAKKSSDPADVITDADVIVLCMPVHQYRTALDRIAPFVNRAKSEVFVGTIYGQAGFNWMVHTDLEKGQGLANIVTFAIGSIPWICRTLKYGSRVANYGGKDVNVVAVTPKRMFPILNDVFLQDISVRPMHQGDFRLACSFISLTLSVDNQIIHPARCYGLWQTSLDPNHGEWSSEEKVPYFYKDFDEQSAQNLKRLDDDYEAVRQAIREHFPDRPFKYMLGYLELENLNHSSGNCDILESLRRSKQLASIKTPTLLADDGVTHRLNTACRFFTDDIPFGLLIAKWIGEKLNVATPFIDEVIVWAQGLCHESFIDPDTGKINVEYCLKEKCTSGIPEAYGITSVEDILD